jgi:hypothetical protein
VIFFRDKLSRYVRFLRGLRGGRAAHVPVQEPG